MKPFEADLKRFTVVKITASRRYRVDDGEFDPAAYGGRIKHLIDEHVTSLGIEQMLPPVALTAPDFTEKVEALPGGSRAKASEMEHAIRHHITVNKAKDPAYYQQLSERLEEILQQLKDDWNQQILALEGLITELREDAPENPHGLSPVESALRRPRSGGRHLRRRPAHPRLRGRGTGRLPPRHRGHPPQGLLALQQGDRPRGVSR